MSNLDNLLPYGFALIVAVPFVILLRQFVFQFIKLNILNSKNNVLQLLHKTLENSPNVSLQEFKTLFLMGYMDGEDYISDTIQNLRNEISSII